MIDYPETIGPKDSSGNPVPMRIAGPVGPVGPVGPGGPVGVVDPDREHKQIAVQAFERSFKRMMNSTILWS